MSTKIYDAYRITFRKITPERTNSGANQAPEPLLLLRKE